MTEPLKANVGEGVNISEVSESFRKKEKEVYKITITPNIDTPGIEVKVDGWDAFSAQIVLSNAIEAVRKEVMKKSKIFIPQKGKRIIQ